MSYNISVIMPVYNAEQFIETAVSSVLNQPYKNINVIIIDDGSTDSSGKICDEIADNNNRVYVIHQKNSGVSVARNNGIKYIVENIPNCNYVIFLDADDFWFKNTITKSLVDSFNDIDIIGMSTYFSNMSGTRFQSFHVYAEKTITRSKRGILDWIFGGTFGAHFINVDIFKKYNLRFMDGVKISEDLIFMRQFFLCAKSTKFMSTPLYAYRRNDKSVMHTSKINLNNANDIALAWFKSKDFVDTIDEISIDVKEEWHHSCELKTGITLLDTAMELAKAGFNRNQIEETIYNTHYSYCYNLLNYNILDPYHQKPYLLINKSMNKFVIYYRVSGILLNTVRRISKLKIMSMFNQRIRYPLKINDIIE